MFIKQRENTREAVEWGMKEISIPAVKYNCHYMMKAFLCSSPFPETPQEIYI